MSLVEVENPVVRYPVPRGLVGTVARRPRQTVHAVDGVSFSLGSGEILALVGESGCGKTTTAQTLLRLVEPEAGSIRFEGRDVTRLSVRELRRVREALERVELVPAELFLDRYPHELSGGQRQRVAIAASLVLEPRLLVADEPVSMLDVSVRAGILRLLDGLREGGLGILMITHDLSTAARFSDRIAVMYLGRIVEEGPASEVVRNAQHPYTRALLSVVPKRDPRERMRPQILRGEPPDAVRIPPGCRFHPRCPLAIDACRAQDPPLERPAAATGV